MKGWRTIYWRAYRNSKVRPLIQDFINVSQAFGRRAIDSETEMERIVSKAQCLDDKLEREPNTEYGIWLKSRSIKSVIPRLRRTLLLEFVRIIATGLYSKDFFSLLLFFFFQTKRTKYTYGSTNPLFFDLDGIN